MPITEAEGRGLGGVGTRPPAFELRLVPMPEQSPLTQKAHSQHTHTHTHTHTHPHIHRETFLMQTHALFRPICTAIHTQI